MQISYLFGGPIGASPISVQGNGVVVHNNGQLVGRPLIGVGAISIDDPDGIGGSPTFRTSPNLGTLIGADGNTTADQRIAVTGAAKYTVREVIFFNSSAAPSVMAGGLYTYTDKGGRILVPASQVYTALDPADPRKILRVPVSLPYLLEAPILYLSLTTPQGSALTFDVVVIGDVIEAPVT